MSEVLILQYIEYVDDVEERNEIIGVYSDFEKVQDAIVSTVGEGQYSLYRMRAMEWDEDGNRVAEFVKADRRVCKVFWASEMKIDQKPSIKI